MPGTADFDTFTNKQEAKDMFMIVKLTSLKNDNSGIIYAQPEKDCFFCGRKNIFCVTFPLFCPYN